MLFFKTGCNRTLNPALWRGSVGASGRREPCARKPDPHRSLKHGGGSLSLSGLSFSHCAVMWMTSEVVDLELVVASFCQGQSRWGSLSRAGPSRPVLNHHPALPYPVLLTLLLSFRMKKAGLDLPLRQFQGTFRPPQVFETLSGAPTPPPICFPSLYLKNLESSLLPASCGHRPWFCDCIFFFVGP